MAVGRVICFQIGERIARIGHGIPSVIHAIIHYCHYNSSSNEILNAYMYSPIFHTLTSYPKNVHIIRVLNAIFVSWIFTTIRHLLALAVCPIGALLEGAVGQRMTQ